MSGRAPRGPRTSKSTRIVSSASRRLPPSGARGHLSFEIPIILVMIQEPSSSRLPLTFGRDGRGPVRRVRRRLEGEGIIRLLLWHGQRRRRLSVLLAEIVPPRTNRRIVISRSNRSRRSSSLDDRFASSIFWAGRLSTATSKNRPRPSNRSPIRRTRVITVSPPSVARVHRTVSPPKVDWTAPFTAS